MVCSWYLACSACTWAGHTLVRMWWLCGCLLSLWEAPGRCGADAAQARRHAAIHAMKLLERACAIVLVKQLFAVMLLDGQRARTARCPRDGSVLLEADEGVEGGRGRNGHRALSEGHARPRQGPLA